MKGRKKRDTGGANEAAEDLATKNEARTDAKKIDAEAEEKKKGGRVKKARGGKSVGVISGPEPPANAGRKPRASGGRTAESNPFTKANKGKDPKGHKTGGPANPELEGEDEKA
jgi:hypothetical protein